LAAAAQGGTIVVPVIAGVGGGRRHAGTQATGLAAGFANSALVTRSLCQSRTIAIFINAGTSSGERSISRSSHILTINGGNSCSNGAHIDTPLKPDEAIFSPIGTPAVLDEPVVNAIVGAITNNSDGVICGSASRTAGKHTAAIALKGSL